MRGVKTVRITQDSANHKESISTLEREPQRHLSHKDMSSATKIYHLSHKDISATTTSQPHRHVISQEKATERDFKREQQKETATLDPKSFKKKL